MAKFTRGSAGRIVPVTLTFPMLDESIFFPLREETSGERKLRTAAEAELTAKERKDTAFQRNVKFLAAQIADEPQGLGDFPAPETELPEGQLPRSLAQRVTDYFSDADDEKLVELAGYLVNRYWALVTPTEFFL
jgi:hypothetical protein